MSFLVSNVTYVKFLGVFLRSSMWNIMTRARTDFLFKHFLEEWNSVRKMSPEIIWLAEAFACYSLALGNQIRHRALLVKLVLAHKDLFFFKKKIVLLHTGIAEANPGLLLHTGCLGLWLQADRLSVPSAGLHDRTATTWCHGRASTQATVCFPQDMCWWVEWKKMGTGQSDKTCSWWASFC